MERISGTSDGTTGGMAATFDRRTYVRWEIRMALPAGDNEYHGVAILWPDPDATPNGPAQMLVDRVRVYDVAIEP
jgi:hypothetical protein